jgi:predicted NUDIX family NTP pyrophosphohydrolase
MRKSAGILLYKKTTGGIEFFLVHPGGPYWEGKEEGAWSLPKGEFAEGEEPFATALREFKEETGQEISGDFIELAPVRQKGGKIVYAWAVEGDADVNKVVSNTFRQEYPYKSGKWITVPEVDKAGWFTPAQARVLMNSSQAAFLDDLLSRLAHEKSI